MAKKKYIKDSRGMTVSVTTDTLGLEKPLLNENYDIDVHNRNMDKIDEDLKPIDDSYIIELFQHDGDTSRPRDYYTKEESDLKYATKEEVENIDLSNLATKEEANNALNKANEAFLRGDNVKTQLVDKLISEGFNVSTDNTFEELIGNIALGKKWATGTVGVSSLYAEKYYKRNGYHLTGNCYYVTVNNLEFNPTLVILVGTESDYTSCISVFNKEYDNNSCSVATCSGVNSTTAGYNIMVNYDTLNVGFGTSLGSFILPVTANRTYNWIAFE